MTDRELSRAAQRSTLLSSAPTQGALHSRAEKQTRPKQVEPDERSVGFAEHLAFFDQDGDGSLSLQETQRGLEKLGLGLLISIPGAFVVNLGVAGLARAQRKPLNPMHLPVTKTGFVRHPDTQLVDAAGNFDEERLDALFAQYGKAWQGEALGLAEIMKMALDGPRRAGGPAVLLPVGVAATMLEWVTLWWVARTPRGNREVLEKSDVRRFYTDSRFFHEVAQRINEARAQRESTKLGRLRNALQTWLI